MRNILIISGPTASGKTALSLELTERLSGEIISCDSMQLYRGMDIGTAKATLAERERIPHHLIDILSPDESFSAEQYRKLAMEKISEISGRGKLPVFVGGTGLYIDTLLRGESIEVPESDPEYRDALLAKAQTAVARHALWERLRSVDPESAELIHENNVRRVIRALEIYEKTGKPKSFFDKKSREVLPDLNAPILVLDFYNRENLYQRVDARVDKMLSDGLLDEVRALYGAGLLSEKSTAGQAIGYKELISFLKGEATLSEATELIKLSTRRYAKRQLTWFRHLNAIRIMADREDGSLRSSSELVCEAYEAIKNKLI